MLRKIFVTSDQHWCHSNILKFKVDDKLIRPEFEDVADMNDVMIERWNTVVSKGDIVYHLGDVGFNKPLLDKILPTLNGHKRLILGNHDKFHMNFYIKHFDRIMSSRRFGSVVLTHIPILMENHEGLNIHGHIHAHPAPTEKHVNVSVEQTNYYPVELETIAGHIKGFRR